MAGIKSYNIGTGTIGFVEDKKKMEFPTDDESTEYQREIEDAEDEFHWRANRLAEPPAYIKGWDY